METKDLKSNWNITILYSILIGLLVFTSYLVFAVFQPYIWSGFIALVLYLSTRQIYKKIKSHLPRRFLSLAPYLMTSIIITLVVLPSYFIVSNLIVEGLNLIAKTRIAFSEDKIVETMLRFPILIDFITENEFFWVKFPAFYRDGIASYVDILNFDNIYSILKNSTSYLMGSFDLPMEVLFNAFFLFLMLFFLYKEGDTVERWIQIHLPFSMELETRLAKRIESAISAVVMGNFFISLLQAIYIYILLLFTDLNNIFLYATISFIFSLIPVIGTAVVWLPVGLYLGFFDGNWFFGFGFMILGFSGYLFLENFLKPKILDKSLKLHPFLIFLSLIGGLKEFGILGVVIGPMSVTILIILWDFWRLFRDNQLRMMKEKNQE